ncbi:hypothetical protein [Streptomyces sp. 3212.3]|uniref:hypothetical protein n=1 Tax=Streptomyces sp. 3212.3 TaxID=1938846 RepID=UPI0011C0D77A|nr:hypothetical protein [Streptomyces sp. 3212.3]
MAVNLGGVALGVAIVLVYFIRWIFKEKRRPGALVPFVLAHLYGMLAALAALGTWSVLGAVTWVNLWAANVAGYGTLVWGVGGTAPDVTRAQRLVLTSGGYVIVFLFTAVLIALWKWAPKVPNAKLFFGAFSGIAVALSGNVAGIAAVPLGSSVNLMGVLFTQAFG